jgi:hypothetical protein
MQNLPTLDAAVGASLARIADRLATTFAPVDAFLAFDHAAGILVRLSGSPASVSGENPDPQVLIEEF